MTETMKALYRQHDRELAHVGWIALLLGIVIGMVAVLLLADFTVDPPCHEDEVFAWFGDYPDDVVWRCVPLDNLIEETTR